MKKLFRDFVELGMYGRFEEALELIEEPYIGVGMGEQGIIRSKAEAELIIRDGYLPKEGDKIEYEIKNLSINYMGSEAAVIIAEVKITNIPKNGNPMQSGLIQTVGASKKSKGWKISFTHASPIVLSEESVEAYPIRFLDKTLSALKADLKAGDSAQRDALTGILNRDGFDSRVAKQIENYDPSHNTALFMVDLDDFKQINDRLGHQTGDIVLKQVAEVLRNTFRDSDSVGRIGGDEFMVFLTGNFSSKFLENKADELLNTMKLRMGENYQVPISVSIGIGYGHEKITFEKLYRIADIALYTAKKAGKCRYHIINSDTNAQHSYIAASANLLSLQTLLEYTDDKDIMYGKTPFEALVDNIPGGVVMYELTDNTVRVNHCNEWFCRLVGYTKEELETMEAEDPLGLVYPQDRDMMQDAIQSIRGGADSSSIIYRVCHKDGSYSYISQIATVTERRSGNLILYGIESDVDEIVSLKQKVENSHKELEYSNRKLEALLSAIPGGVAIIELGERLKLTQYGTWIRKFSGYDSDEEIEQARQGEKLSTVWYEDLHKVQEALRRVREEGEDRLSVTVRFNCKGGVIKPADIIGSVIERTEEKITMYLIYTEHITL